MEDVHGKAISLQYVTVKIPGQKPRGSKTVNSTTISEPFVNLSISSKLAIHDITQTASILRETILAPDNSVMKSDLWFVFFPLSSGSHYKEKKCSDKVLLTAFEVFKEPNSKTAATR